MSSPAYSRPQILDFHFSQPYMQHSTYQPPTPLSSPPFDTTSDYWEAAAYTQALALLQQPPNPSVDNQIFPQQSRSASITSAPAHLPSVPTIHNQQQDQAVQSAYQSAQYWPMYHNFHNNSMGGPVTAQKQGLKRQRNHQRTPSASTIASNGPASPYTHTTSYPHIANTEYAPNSPGHHFESTQAFADQAAAFPKHLATPVQTPTDGLFSNIGYTPSQAAHTPAAHLAMKGFAIDHHNLEDLPLDFPNSARHSMSTIGQDSPPTPRSAMGEERDRKLSTAPANDYQQVNPDVQLSRTESAAYQDELYNPANFAVRPSSAKRQQPGHFLSPHRNLVNERLQTANIARSVSPNSAVSRERSPFRQNSPLAPTEQWSSPRPAAGTLADMRQQQKEDAEQAEYAQHMPALQREPTKTISPKDALLDYTGEDQPSLFQDTVPEGYKQHFGTAQQFPSNFVGQQGAAYHGLPLTGQQSMANFRATSAAGFSDTNYSSTPPTYQARAQISSNPYQQGTYQSAANMDSYGEALMPPEQAPQFPATLTSMESSVSDNAPVPSSQESNTNNLNISAPHRPADTRAATGTYTCTYHNCTQRFDTPTNLQKHKRDFHRSQQQQQLQLQQVRDNLSSAPDTVSTSPHTSRSPSPAPSGMSTTADDSTTGLTSAALLARNTQAGPHKCTRINPSTNKPCNTIFSRPYDLTRHEDTIHNNRKQKVRCMMCREEKTFSRNDALTRHMRVVHPEVEGFGGKRARRE